MLDPEIFIENKHNKLLTKFCILLSLFSDFCTFSLGSAVQCCGKYPRKSSGQVKHSYIKETLREKVK